MLPERVDNNILLARGNRPVPGEYLAKCRQEAHLSLEQMLLGGQPRRGTFLPIASVFAGR